MKQEKFIVKRMQFIKHKGYGGIGSRWFIDKISKGNSPDTICEVFNSVIGIKLQARTWAYRIAKALNNYIKFKQVIDAEYKRGFEAGVASKLVGEKVKKNK